MKQLSSEIPLKYTNWLARYHHVLIPTSMPSTRNDWLLNEISAADFDRIWMDWFNISVKTDFRFFSKILAEGKYSSLLQMWYPFYLGLLHLIIPTPFLENKGRIVPQRSPACVFFFFGDNLKPIKRFRGICNFTVMFRLRKDEHKLSQNCTKPGI